MSKDEKNKSLITKKAVFEVLLEYWKQYKVYPFRTFIALFVPAVGSLLIYYIPPLVIGKLINVLALD